MTEKVKERALYDDLVAAPEDRIAEIVTGSLYLSPRPSLRHSRIVSTLGADIHDAFDRARRGPGGWLILDEPEVHLLNDVVVPDIAGWRRDRVPATPEQVAMTIAPDWACEVLSPSTEQFDRREKLPWYLAVEVGHLWLVDPPFRRLEVYARHAHEWILLETYANEAVVSAPPFEAVPIELAPLWS
ncbi:MAG: Uma2 family endonuclease [Thermoanaerobaculia bacterium]